MGARIIDGKAVAGDLLTKVATEAARLTKDHGLTPGLAVVLVGNNPASEIYVRSKSMRTVAAGMRATTHKLPETITKAELLRTIQQLNGDRAVHGILVQLPLRRQIDPRQVIVAIDPAKDVDGFHPLNAGRLAIGLPALVPCTPLGCIRLAKTVHASLTGLDAVVIGRSNIVGKPLAQLLLLESATVTVAHSKTRDLPAVTRRADLVFPPVRLPGMIKAAVGVREMIKGDWIKPGVTVIDVGINRVAAEGGKHRIVGDVAFAEVSQVAGALTPVPGGVGPMTIACLMLNTLRAASQAAGLP